MAIRYTDFAASSQHADFVARNRKPTLTQLLLIFLVTMVVSVFIMVTLFSKVMLIACLVVVLGGAGCFVILHIQRNRDLVMATEFQNALFASALGFSNKFCLIIKREGNIVYMDNAFQTLFPDLVKERHLSIASMLKFGRVDTAEREKIFAAIERGVFEKVIFDIRSGDNRTLRLVMSIEPINRPAGYILLRAREYVERSGSAGSPEAAVATGAPSSPLLTKSSITIFSYIMDRMNMGVYLADPAGNIIYANPIVEQWLSYRDGEITGSNFSLKDIVHQGISHPGAITPSNFDGEIALQKKEGGLIRAYVNQKIILSEDKKTLGCVALINNIVERDPEAKKTLW